MDPAQFGSYETAKRTIERQLKLDLQKDVIDQLGGDITAGASPAARRSGPGGRGRGSGRVQVAPWRRSAGCFRRSPSTSAGERVTVRKSGDLYSATSPSGRIAYGLVGDKFVLSDTVAGARAIAASAPTGTSRAPRARSP